MGSQIDIVMMKKEMTIARPKTDSLTGYFQALAIGQQVGLHNVA
jgi:hypothetical protein